MINLQGVLTSFFKLLNVSIILMLSQRIGQRCSRKKNIKIYFQDRITSEQDDGLADEAPVPDVHPGGQDGHEQPEPRHCLVTKHSQVIHLFAGSQTFI
jgi:hypothetical protein